MCMKRKTRRKLGPFVGDISGAARRRARGLKQVMVGRAPISTVARRSKGADKVAPRAIRRRSLPRRRGRRAPVGRSGQHRRRARRSPHWQKDHGVLLRGARLSEPRLPTGRAHLRDHGLALRAGRGVDGKSSKPVSRPLLRIRVHQEDRGRVFVPAARRDSAGEGEGLLKGSHGIRIVPTRRSKERDRVLE